MPHHTSPLIERIERRVLLASVPAGFTETLIATSLTSPTAIDVAPDGRVFFADQSGHVRVIVGNQLQSTAFADLSAKTDGSGERGMLGMTLDPNFTSNRYVYVYYTANSPASHNRLSRLTADPANPNIMLAGSEQILLEFPNIGSAIWHMGGSIQFGVDGKIYIALGDHQQSTMSQDLNSVFGKILRVNSDGTIPADNPFYSQTTGINQAIWARGLRNPFTTAMQPGTGRFFINDVGEGQWEEIDNGVAGANYGWPTTEGDFTQSQYPNFTRPFYTYYHTPPHDAITGGAFYNPSYNQFPAQYVGKYFFVDFGSGEMYTVDPTNSSTVTTFATGLSWAVGVDVGSDGSLYYVSRGAGAGGQPGLGTGRVLKIQYATNLAPTIAQHPQNQLVSVGYPVTFTIGASGSPPLSYQWTRNGVDIAGATAASYTIASATMSDNGAAFRVRIVNGYGNITSNPATLTVTSNIPPTAIINTPAAGSPYHAGDTIVFLGAGSDPEDITVPSSRMTWWVDFHHDTHFHPFMAAFSGAAGGQFTILTSGETSPNVWYRIHLLVTDSIGLQHETYRDVLPITAMLNITSNVAGIQFTLDGQPKTMPLAVQGVAGLVRGIAVQQYQQIGGQWYQFTGWSDGGPRDRDYPFPSASTTLTATFLPVSLVYLSDLPFAATPINGWGPPERDKSNADSAAGDGRTLTLNGTTYAKGFGVHAQTSPPGRLTFHLDGAYGRFKSDVGVDDEVNNTATIVFQVFADGIQIYDSGIMDPATATKSIDLDVAGVRVLELVIADGGNGIANDHGDWAGALLYTRPGPAAPVAHYEFDDATGTTVRDLSTSANHGTSSGTVTWVPGLIAKNAMSFDGSTGIVTVPNAAQLNPTSAISVAAWINATTWAGGARRILQKGNSGNQYLLTSTGTQLQWSVAGIGTASAALPSTGAWHHIAGSCDGTSVRLYVDGALVASAASAAGTLPTTTDPLAIGGRNTGAASERFSGSIDDVRICNRVLGAQEVNDLAHPININFQPAGAPTPAGYFADTGDLYAARGNGYTYGFSSSHTDTSRDRNAAAQPDQRLDTLIQMHANQKWEIALPNGLYRVYISVGDASFNDFTPTLNIEGTNAYTNLAMTVNSFAWVSRVVEVLDGKLTLDQGADSELQLRLNYIQIYGVGGNFAWKSGSTLNVDMDPTGTPITLSSNAGMIDATKNATTLSFSGITTIIVNGTTADDSLAWSGPIAAPLTFNGNGGNDMLSLQSGAYTFAGDIRTMNNAGTMSLTVNPGASAVFSATQHLRNLTIAAGASASIGANGTRYLHADTLSIQSAGKLDLNDNDLIVNSAPFSTIRGWVFSGYSSSPDASRSGIISSTSQNTGGKTMFALIANAALSAWPPGSGNSVAPGTIIGKYTWFGDADFNGMVTGDDYVALDANLGTTVPASTGWLAGDMNFDGSVTGDDYLVLDANLHLGEGNPLSPAFSPLNTMAPAAASSPALLIPLRAKRAFADIQL